MATVRLSTMIKEIVEERLLKNAFEKREQALKKAQHRFAGKIYNDVYSLKERKAMAGMPDGFMETSSSLKVQFRGDFTHVHFGESRRIASKHKYNCSKHKYNCSKVYDANDPLCDEHVKLKQEADDLEREKREARVDLNAVLDRVTTVKRLIELWPEVEPWVKDFIEPPIDSKNLPCLPISELNKTLGLEKQAS